MKQVKARSYIVNSYIFDVTWTWSMIIDVSSEILPIWHLDVDSSASGERLMMIASKPQLL